jgi:hypothetical protein
MLAQAGVLRLVLVYGRFEAIAAGLPFVVLRSRPEVETSSGIGWWAYDRAMLTVVEAEPNWVAWIALSRIGR